MSVALPAVNGTTKVICFVGQACAWAVKDALHIKVAIAAVVFK
jgi:hypothetical protein